MGCKVTVLCFFYLVFATVRAIEVNLSNVWKQDLGWEIRCSWAIPTDDSLRSVRLYKNYQEFYFFSPESGSGSHVEYIQEDKMSTRCSVADNDRQKGACVITLELYQPQRNNFTMSCEVSGEGPYYIKMERHIVVEKFVPPTDAVMSVSSVSEESGRVTLNCSAEGVPLPTLSWTFAGQVLPRDMSGGDWNPTSKLWHAWSVFSYTPSSRGSVVCTPSVSRVGKVVTGHAAEYNTARNIKGGVFNAIITVLFLLLLR